MEDTKIIDLYFARDQEPIDEAQAQAILAKYSRVQLNLRPISELGK